MEQPPLLAPLPSDVGPLPAPMSPLWWLLRLHGQMRSREVALAAAERWYSGPHPAPKGYGGAQDVLNRLLEMANANFMGLVVDAAVERLHVEGFRIAGKPADDAWRIWQGNGFDLGSELVWVDSLALGEASVLVDPCQCAAGVPTITPEHPLQTIVEHAPGNYRERVAGLKVYLDDQQTPPLLTACVYGPDRMDVFQTVAPAPNQPLPNRPRWEHQDGMSGPHGLGEVPLVAFPNRPRMLKSGTPEFDRVVPIQKRINKTLLDRMVNQEYGAFAQKWVTGMEIPLDPVTNQPVEPFRAAIDHLFVGEDPGIKFGQFTAEDIASLTAGVDADVKHIAAIVPTPPHYLLGELTNLSAEALKASEAALVSRVRRHMRHFEEPLEAVVRLALRADGKSSADAGESMETVWRNPEFRTEGELVDALVKMSTLGVPNEALWARWGATPQEVADWTKAQKRQQALAALGQALTPAPAPGAAASSPGAGAGQPRPMGRPQVGVPDAAVPANRAPAR